MFWNLLLSPARLSDSSSATRSPFNQDYGRVLYSSAFRRLQDKTQVFPLGRNDYVRTRLTHSLEVANVGRTLAEEMALLAEERDSLPLREGIKMTDIVATACLAHDIGNPPFGHSGEKAIEEAVALAAGEMLRKGLPVPAWLQDFRFEGNAQGFRLLTRTCDPIRGHGLNLTFATLGAFSKYPCTAAAIKASGLTRYGKKGKFGLAEEDLPTFACVADACGLPLLAPGVWARHPLAFLMEAADDVSYLVADIEDAYVSHIISYDKAVAMLCKLAGMQQKEPAIRKEADEKGQHAAIRMARAMAVGNCIAALRESLRAHYAAIMEGCMEQGLMDASYLAAPYNEVRHFSFTEIYSHESVLKVEITGFNIVRRLMELFMEWVQNPIGALGSKIGPILHASPADSESAQARFAHVVDYISGMTDSFALQTYSSLFGCAPNLA